MLNSDNLTLDDNHIYRLDGVPIPGVSEILQAAGISDFSAIPADRIEASCQFGVAVHKACELSDLGTLDIGVLDNNLRPYLQGWETFRQEYGVSCEAIEQKLYHPLYRFAGTIDRIAHWRIDDSLLIIDIKSGADNPAIAIQLRAYELLVKGNTQTKEKIKRVAVMLNDTGTYKIKEYNDKNDINIFLSALSIYNFKRRKNGNKN